jgi:glutathione peroxidase
MQLRTTVYAALSLAAILALGSCSTESVAEASGVSPIQSSEKEPAPLTAAEEKEPAPPASTGIYDLQVPSLAGETVDLSSYAGKVSLVVNVASKCGYTRQYDGLQKLHQEFTDRGFQVLGFPCNDFGGQEPGSADEIGSFCRDKYGVTFPMFAKVKVKGGGPSPIYERLIAATGKTPGWNFCKYLVGKNGEVLHYWKSGTAPDSDELRAAITKAL